MINKRISITDNMQWKPLHEVGIDKNTSDLGLIANYDIATLQSQHPHLLVFPQCLGDNWDDIGNGQIIGLRGPNGNKEISTGNIMGFIGVGDTQLSIISRFSKSQDEDYFLHYMLQRVFRINIFNLNHGTSQEEVFDFRLYLFPLLLQKALQQGLFKQYVRNRKNDANVKGTINVARHIRANIPFRGTIAYDEREHTTDNAMTQLIRHTIEYIANHKYACSILENDQDTIDCIMQIKAATPSYNCQERQTVINKNLRETVHPYYSEYTPLQTLCLQILRQEEIKYGSNEDKVNGVLFDGAWLWEEFLNTIFLDNLLDIKHPENKTSKDPIYLFEPNSFPRFPDFYSREKKLIMDAKYKHLGAKGSRLDRNDVHQIISYMHVIKAERGILLYPDEKQTELNKVGTLNGFGGCFYTLSLHIPQEADNMKDFVNEIKTEESDFVSKINEQA